MIAITEKRLQELLQKKLKRSLSINCKKTEKQSKMELRIGDTKIIQVRKFKFLGRVLTENGKCETKI